MTKQTKTDKNSAKSKVEGGAETKAHEMEEEHSRSYGWKSYLQFGVVLVFLVAAFILSQMIGTEERIQPSPEASKPLLVRTVEVHPETRPVIFRRTGNVEVNGVINVVPQVSGRVIKVADNFNDGDIFEAQSVLFEIEPEDFVNQVDIAQAEVERAETELALQEAESRAAIADWKSLNGSKAVPPLVAQEPQMEQAKANLKAAKARLNDANLALSRTRFSYSFPGRVIDTDIEVGQYLQAGQAYGTVYAKGSLEITIPVEDKILNYIDRDSKVRIQAGTFGGEQILDGRIDRIGSELDRETRFVNLIVEPEGDDWDALLPGVFASVELIGTELSDIWVLPNGTLQGTEAVWIVSQDNTLMRYQPKIISVQDNVTLAVGTGESVRLVNGLLKAGSDGMKVRVIEEEGRSIEAGNGLRTKQSGSGQAGIQPSPESNITETP